jgi:hypothetical protein
MAAPRLRVAVLHRPVRHVRDTVRANGSPGCMWGHAARAVWWDQAVGNPAAVQSSIPPGTVYAV